MATAQVVSASKKPGHLESGKRKLEEFRKKKAEAEQLRKKKAEEKSTKGEDGPNYIEVEDHANLSSRMSQMLPPDSASSVREQLASTSEQLKGNGYEDEHNKYKKKNLHATTSEFLKTYDQLSTSDDHLGTSKGNADMNLPNGFPSASISPELSNVSYSNETGRKDPFIDSKQIDGADSSGGSYTTSFVKLAEQHVSMSNDGYGRQSSSGMSGVHSLASVFEKKNEFDNLYVPGGHLEPNGSLLANYPYEGTGKHDTAARSGLFGLSGAPTNIQNEISYFKMGSGASGMNDAHSGSLTKSSSGPDLDEHVAMNGTTSRFSVMGRMKHSGFSEADNVVEETPAFPFKNSITSSIARSEFGNQRSRPSFLDSIVPKVSAKSESSVPEPDRKAHSELFGSLSFSSRNPSSADLPAIKEPLEEPLNNSKDSSVPQFVATYLSQDLVTDSHESYRDSLHGATLRSSKKNEDFIALEQHIEDLTQEKFSLQRALDESRTFVDSLAAEHSSLTDSFNQQGEVVNQLRSDLERLQEEIRGQLSTLETMRVEYTNAQLECRASDERAKILASEVIGLEEKALRLRSNELKLEKQLEKSNNELSSLKRKISSLERERGELHSTIDALQEEKKLLQSKIRKASHADKSTDVNKPPATQDATTSTDDLAMTGVPIDASGSSNVVNNVRNDGQVDQMDLSLGDSLQTPESVVPSSFASVAVPPDQLRIVGSISALISELSSEKKELMAALAQESSLTSQLKELNKDLSQKLEAQTQRLELLTTQSMVHENVTMKPTVSHISQDVPLYPDEGDEVVERVLGWIMKLFPGGSTKRRTSKLL